MKRSLKTAVGIYLLGNATFGQSQTINQGEGNAAQPLPPRIQEGAQVQIQVDESGRVVNPPVVERLEECDTTDPRTRGVNNCRLSSTAVDQAARDRAAGVQRTDETGRQPIPSGSSTNPQNPVNVTPRR